MPRNYFVIGADVVPTSYNIQLFTKPDVRELVGDEIVSILYNSMHNIFNLEVPLVDVATPIKKEGPNLIAATATVNGYKALRADALTMANNHILDHGIYGLESTIATLEKAGIAYIGAGRSIIEASNIYYFTIDGKRVGIYACAEHEFSIADEDRGGANPFDSFWSFDHVQAAKQQCDFLIVLYHGGKEHYRYPSPGLQKTCKRFIDKGVDLVVCQHSHCIGCMEEYSSGTIIYGQGNFIFDNSNEDCWKTGLLLKIDSQFSISYIPVVKHDHVVRISNDSEYNSIMDQFWGRSREIRNSSFVNDRYTEFAESQLDGYLTALRGKETLVFRVLNKILMGIPRKTVIKMRFKQSNTLALENYIACEAHRELLLQGLRNRNNTTQIEHH